MLLYIIIPMLIKAEKECLLLMLFEYKKKPHWLKDAK